MSQDVKAKLFRGFADPSRLAVLEMLRQGARCVTELVEATRLSQPNVSMHLACLRDCGLVRARRNGRFIYYELADPAVVRMLESAENVLRNVSKLIEACPRHGVSANKDAKGKRTKSGLRV